LLYDPKGDLSKGEKEPFLGEAEKLLDNFGGHAEIKIDLKSRYIEKATVRRFLREYDIIHYAGHADYNEKKPEKSGWELVNGKFVAQDLTKMIGTRKSMPLLVFSNACRSGRVDFTLEQDYQNRVFSLARIFLVSGVRHYIGTFWDILNKESAEFASIFYQNLFAGQSIGEALQKARISFSTTGENQTALWSSYILYGDPSVSYIKSTEQQEISPFGPTTIRGALADTDDSSAVAEVHERIEGLKRPIKKVQWGKIAKIGAMATGIPSMIGLIGFGFFSYFYPQKVSDFLSRRKKFSSPTAIISSRHLLQPVENEVLNSRLIQGEKLIAQGKNLQAQTLFSQMIKKGILNPTQQSQAWNRLGRLYANSNKIDEAIDAFQRSIQANPGLHENYVNKAVLLRDQGDWPTAYQLVKKALEKNPEDDIAKALEEELRGRLALEKDKVRKRRIDQLVRELSEAYRNRYISPPADSSKVKTITFLDFFIRGRVPDRLGEADYLKHTLIQALQKEKEIKIVERVLIDRLLEELKLGSSEVANPSVSVRLGRILAARCIAVGTIYRFEFESEITMKLMDTETSEILAVITEKVKDTDSLHQAAQGLAAKILKIIGRNPSDKSLTYGL
jgi:tetratricopeptide (TPR) repeat protein